MPSPLRDPKALSDWFERDYFLRRRAFRRLWQTLPPLSILAALAVVAWMALPRNHAAFQAGPVSTAHALFNQDCRQCHTETFQTLTRFASFHAGVHAVPDAACVRCHAGPPHQHIPMEERSCASCHKEHRGQTLLARTADSHCTSCHADLPGAEGREPAYARHITGFVAGRHPEFRLWNDPRDPGTIRFNHHVHLAEGGVLQVDPAQLAQLAIVPSRQRVTLRCNSCHEPDATGRTMKPIRYESHCQQCHPLLPQLDVSKDPAAVAVARHFAAAALPHPQPTESPETVRAALREKLSRFILQHGDKPVLKGGKPAAVPEDLLVDPRRAEPLTEAQWTWVNRQLEHTERQLFDGAGGCRYCHREQSDPGQRPNGLPTYAPSSLPTQWFTHSVFDHQSHRMLRCQECHGNAAASASSSDVLLPRSTVCLECHKSSSGNGSNQARGDCVECHRYHKPGQKEDFQGRFTINLQVPIRNPESEPSTKNP